MLIIPGILASQRIAAGDYESIATVTVGAGGSSSVTFSSIPSGYKHLQVRIIARSARSAWGDTLQVRVNGDTGANYYGHYLLGDGANPLVGSYGSTSGLLYCGSTTASSAPTGTMGISVIDILDYASVNKNKVFRILDGNENNSANGSIGYRSGAWNNSSTAINSLVFSVDSATNFQQYSHFALYGVKS